MNTIRMNITVPIDIGRHLKGIKNVSAFISEALKEKFQRQEDEKKKKELDEAYQASAREQKGLLKDWDATVGDGL
jgi:post-segregation antitoxin (ccd killing protein)